MNVLNPRDAAGRPLWVRAVRVITIVYCGIVPAIAVAMMIVVSAVVDQYLSIAEDVVLGLVSGGLLVAPAALYAAVIRADPLVVVVGGGLVALQTWSAWWAFTDDASTAGLALIWIPFAGIPFVLVAWFLEVLSRPPEL